MGIEVRSSTGPQMDTAERLGGHLDLPWTYRLLRILQAHTMTYAWRALESEDRQPWLDLEALVSQPPHLRALMPPRRTTCRSP